MSQRTSAPLPPIIAIRTRFFKMAIGHHTIGKGTISLPAISARTRLESTDLGCEPCFFVYNATGPDEQVAVGTHGCVAQDGE